VAVPDRRLLRSNPKLAAEAALLVDERERVAPVAVLLERISCELKLERLEADRRATIEDQVGLRHDAALQDLAERAVQTLVTRTEARAKSPQTLLRCNRIDPRHERTLGTIDVMDRPSDRVCITRCTRGRVIAGDLAKERRKVRITTAAFDLTMTVCVPPFRGGRAVWQIVDGKIDGPIFRPVGR
jgi:hypothetical protein